MYTIPGTRSISERYSASLGTIAGVAGRAAGVVPKDGPTASRISEGDGRRIQFVRDCQALRPIAGAPGPVARILASVSASIAGVN